MDQLDPIITEQYALYHDDCLNILPHVPDASVHLSIYSPPFKGLYVYSSDPRDLSNSLNDQEFYQHYAFIVKELHRVIMPGRLVAVHTMDIPTGNTGLDQLIDFPGDVIRLHQQHGFVFVARYMIWKEPLMVRNRTMTKSLSHKTIVDDSTHHSIANADQLLIFRRSGKNAIPVTHQHGFDHYAGSRTPPVEVLPYRNWAGNQIENQYSHWIWRQYASSVWDDIRIDRVLPHREAKEDEDEKHVHPLQLDVIERCLQLYTNPGETVLTPFAGVGSEAYGAVASNRRAIAVELKAAYYHQMVKNLAHAGQHASDHDDQQVIAFDEVSR